MNAIQQHKQQQSESFCFLSINSTTSVCSLVPRLNKKQNVDFWCFKSFLCHNVVYEKPFWQRKKGVKLWKCRATDQAAVCGALGVRAGSFYSLLSLDMNAQMKQLNIHLPDVCVIIGPRKVDEVSVLKICYVTFLHQNIYIFLKPDLRYNHRFNQGSGASQVGACPSWRERERE